MSPIASDTRFLIILMGAIGDVARGLCIASYLKQRLPRCRITWLVEPGSASLVACHNGIDTIVIFDRPRHIYGVWKLYKELSAMRFDITLDLQRHFKSGFFSFLSGAPRRIGFHRSDAKEFNWMFNTEQINAYGKNHAKLDHYFAFTEHVGLSKPSLPDFGLSRPDMTAYPELTEKLNPSFIVIIMGSSWESKDWLPERYHELVLEILRRCKVQVILEGDRSQIDIANFITETIRSENDSAYTEDAIINWVGKTSLPQLVSILKAAHAAIGPDSGPGHIAAAVGTPYISLFGPTSPARVAPYNSGHLVVSAHVDCSPCNKRHCFRKDKICMKRIRVEMVMEKLAGLIECHPC